NLDLGSSVLEPLKPLRTHIVLTDGVLTLRDFDARTGQGRLYGMLQLDGRTAPAIWNADMRWEGIRLESWIKQARDDNAPPYITGRFGGQARVTGQGKSTAAILGSLRGGVRVRIADGSVSHLIVEATGLDIAQGLGMLLKGDDSLALQCTVADFSAEQGVLRPRAFVVDTTDSLLLVDGSISLASEGMDLKITSLPKDFSPFALRTPVRLRGSFADPSVSLDPSRLAPRVGAAAVLALLNPVAAVLPFIDFGDTEEAKKGVDACRELSNRIAAKPLLPAPAAKPPRAG
ncbi:MAG: AsmA family protein, partial [Rhizobiales bacterium]|nr:AsmA family protein [Rhizobacter sp.]